jgi:2-C-methyl-D-erythritol 2,4-cyclodiphosphate synthase
MIDIGEAIIEATAARGKPRPGSAAREIGRLAPWARVVRARPARYNPARNAKTSLGPRSGDQPTPGSRIGIGHDTHRLAPGGPLRLGGIDIPSDVHAVGHSDADALLHAVIDALLGAAALGDIGEMFPDGDPANRGRDSAQMLLLAWRKVAEHGLRIANLDCVVQLEKPKLSPHKPSICRRIADVLGVPVESVGLKAKTGEQVGPVGRGEAIVAQCVALLETQEEKH